MHVFPTKAKNSFLAARATMTIVQNTSPLFWKQSEVTLAQITLYYISETLAVIANKSEIHAPFGQQN